jgi:hypothetical protein
VISLVLALGGLLAVAAWLVAFYSAINILRLSKRKMAT